jgi:recombination protein RecA
MTIETNASREQAVQAVVGAVEKQFGKGALLRLGEGGPTQNVSVISTGSLSLDVALGTGGLPRGRMVEVYGPESSGKTTLALHVVAEAQRTGGICAFIDAEHALDVGYARASPLPLVATVMTRKRRTPPTKPEWRPAPPT